MVFVAAYMPFVYRVFNRQYTVVFQRNRDDVFATSFLENGGGLAALKKILGHTSISTTEKYLHPGIKDASEIINYRNRKNQGLSLVKGA